MNLDKLLNEVSPPLIKQPLTRGGEKGTHGVDESVRTDQNNQGMSHNLQLFPTEARRQTGLSFDSY